MRPVDPLARETTGQEVMGLIIGLWRYDAPYNEADKHGDNCYPERHSRGQEPNDSHLAPVTWMFQGAAGILSHRQRFGPGAWGPA